MKESKNTCTLYIRDVPGDVKRRFKVWCAENGVSMTEKIVALMKATSEAKTAKR